MFVLLDRSYSKMAAFPYTLMETNIRYCLMFTVLDSPEPPSLSIFHVCLAKLILYCMRNEYDRMFSINLKNHLTVFMRSYIDYSKFRCRSGHNTVALAAAGLTNQASPTLDKNHVNSCLRRIQNILSGSLEQEDSLYYDY